MLDYFRTLDIYERWLFKKPTFLLFFFNPAALPVGPGRFEIFGGQLQVQPYEFRRYFQRGGKFVVVKTNMVSRSATSGHGQWDPLL